MKTSSVFSLGAILLVLISGIGYLGFVVLQMNPLTGHITATMTLPGSGGIGVGSPVLLSGLEAGKVTSVRKIASGVEITLHLQDSPPIPVASTVRIENLSALGEPYIEFEAERNTGPYIRDNQSIDTGTAQLPMTIPEVSERVVKVLQQLDPKTIAELVGTADVALTGTDNEIPRLARSTTLLAATLLSRTSTIRQLLTDLQTLGSDMNWTGPSLAAGGPEWADLGRQLADAIAVTAHSFDKGIQPAAYLQQDGLVAFLHDLTTYLEKIGPRTAAQLPALRPLLDSARDSAAQLDLGALLSQALSTVGTNNAVRLQIHVK
ncbi:MlaD family protein [Nocardia sp. NPDC050175]|uniref:MlaD family protein n=1 Tax=Nocardia sp. NPDC050175 TaxID=3364317 RepID=UPI00379063CA